MAEITIRLTNRAVRTAAILVVWIVLASVFFYFLFSGAFTPKYRLRVFVPETSGLDVRAQVRLDGIPVGTISAVKLATESAGPDRRVELVLRIDKRYQDSIRSDAVATAASDGLLGPRYVSIQRGFKGNVISPDGEIKFLPEQEMSFKEILKSVEKAKDCTQVEKNSAENKVQVP